MRNQGKTSSYEVHNAESSQTDRNERPTLPEPPHIITLGTAGGPSWQKDAAGTVRNGTSTALVTENGWYLIDCGQGTGRALAESGLSLKDLRGIFITHLHSDHIADLSSLVLFAPFMRSTSNGSRIPLIGPGSRGKSSLRSERATKREAISLTSINPGGLEHLFKHLVMAFEADIDDRTNDTLADHPSRIFDVRDIAHSHVPGFDPNENVSPPMHPLLIFQDDDVTVEATLVSHHPMAPAYAFRFTTSDGIVTISGDTGPCKNLVDLARGSDVLIHEAILLEALPRKFENQEMHDATLDHHRRAHTSPSDAGLVALEAEVKTLILHHLVPVAVPEDIWSSETRKTWNGPLIIAQDCNHYQIKTPIMSC